MLYPRIIEKGTPITAEQMVGAAEHLMNRNHVYFLQGTFTGSMDAHNYLLAMDSIDHKPKKLVITSPGGDLDSAFLLYDTIRLIKSPVYTLGRYCASAAALILAAGKKRYLMPHAKVMLHLPSGMMGGDAKEWDIQHRQMRTYVEKMADILVECGVKKTQQEVIADIDRDRWFEPEEAIEYGLADEIIDKKTLGVWLACPN